MASNIIPTSASEIIGLGTKMDQGLITYGTALKITQITAAQFEGELAAFIAANNGFNAARSARQSASDLFKPADEALSDWLQVTRNVLAARFGSRWSTEWAQAGFINSTTRVPTRIEGRLALALALFAFLTANPGYEVPSLAVTAGQAKALRDAAVSGQEQLATAEIALKDKGTTYDTAYVTLTDTMRSLVKILGATLENDDPRWLAFGLNMPATNTTPGQPTNLSAHLDDTGTIILQCDPVPLAMRFRWRGMLVGVESEYRLMARSTEPIGSVSGLLPGQKVQFIVQAVNGNLQGVPSEPVLFTVPPVVSQAKLALEPSVAVEETMSRSHKNGRAGSEIAARRISEQAV